MDRHIEEIAKHVSHNNVETKLFRFRQGTHAGRYAVRVRDLDAEENVSLIIYPTLERARAACDVIVRWSGRKAVVA